jgi:neutral ceramidase
MNITPKTAQWLMGYGPRTSTGVRDAIFHRIVAMDDGKAQFYLIASDLCLFSPGFYDEAMERLRRDLGIDRRSVWWSVTHTHSAPEVGPPGLYKTLLGRSDHEWNREYAGTVTDALVEGVKKARAKLEPARVGIGVAISMANINRRAKDVDGSVSLGLNPDGVADRQMGIIRLDRPDGSPIGVVVNYAMHGTVLGPSSLQISGDALGTVSAYVEQKIGVPALYVNGAAGNLAPIYSVFSRKRVFV